VRGVELKLYVIPGSHPCHAVEAALALKGLDYERVDLLPGASQFIQRARFGRRTVPGLEVDGYRVSGSKLILRTLDGIRHEPRLYPADPDALAAVEAAEAWADRDLQDAARWIIVYALGRHPQAAESFLEGANLPRLPSAVADPMTRAIFTTELRVLAGGPDGTRRALGKLPALLDHADQLIADGVIGGDEPNAADLQVAGCVALLLTCEDLRNQIADRPCGQLALRLLPDYPGNVPAGSLPPEWIPAPVPVSA
jgi:glutathione S-transferase